jgi:thioredoxin reductase (NADPH)
LAQIARPAGSKISWHWTTTDSSLTGEILTAAEGANWQPGRPPFLLETRQPGVFGAGDVRSGSVKRVTAAAGEGSMAVRLVQDHLEDLGAPLS